ncbi:MAG: protein kinase [Chloroflexota bacterium]
MFNLQRGTVLGQYVILERIAHGGSSTVYRAHQPSLDRIVAVKVLAYDHEEDADFMARFRREARAVSHLRHPNILTVYDFGTHDGVTFMVSEYLSGGTLAARLGKPLPPDQVRSILRAIGGALDHAHKAGVVHRDVKPSNVLFTADGTPVLSDFGIARILEGDEHSTGRGAMLGTPHYMSPEQAAGVEATAASDVYSLGVVLYEMVAGQPPFSGFTPIGLIRAHLEEPPPSPRRFNPAVPEVLESVFARALAKRPEQRYSSAAELCTAFDRALGLAADAPEQIGQIERTESATLVMEPETVGAALPLAADGPAPEPREDEAATAQFDPAAEMAASERADASATSVVLDQPRPRGRRSALIVAVLAGIIVAGTLFVVAVLARGSTLAPSGPVGSAATAVAATPPGTAVVEAATPPPLTPAAQAAPASAVASPTPIQAAAAASLPPAPVAPSPVAVNASPTAVAAPTGPLAVQILTPRNDEAVGTRPRLSGIQRGAKGPDEHVWLLFHPRGDADVWWPYPREVQAAADGTWEVVDAEVGGPPGVRHDIVVVSADTPGQTLILDQIRLRPGEPFREGIPAALKVLSRVTVVKG